MAIGRFPIVHCCHVGCIHHNVGNPRYSPAQTRHEILVSSGLCFHNASRSRHCRSSRSVIVVDCSFGHAGRQPRQSKGHCGSLAPVRFGTSCCSHTYHRIDHFVDRFGDSDHLFCNHGRDHLFCNHGRGPVDNQDTAPGQYCFPLSRFPTRQRMPVRAHLFFYSSNSLVLIPPLRKLMATAMPLRSRRKNPDFYAVV